MESVVVDDNLKDEVKEKEFTAFIPFITAGLIFLGVSKLIYYYGYFGVNIVSFLDFGEILTSFLDYVVSLTFVSVMLLAQFLMKDQEPSAKKTAMDNNSSKINKGGYYRTILFLFIAIAWLIYLLFFMIDLILNNWEAVLIVGIGISLCFFIARLFYKLAQKQRIFFFKHLFRGAMIIITAEILIIFVAIFEYRQVKHHQKYFGTTITFNNETFMEDSTHEIQSDSSNFYIGKTNNYIFIHHKKKETTSIYPMSSVLQIELKINNGEKNWFQRLID